MSSRGRGRELERRAAKLLTDAGWLVHLTQSTPTRKVLGPEVCAACNQPTNVRWISRRNDLFGVFDVLALSPDTALGVQVSLAGASEKRKKIDAWLKSRPFYGMPNVRIEVWIWNGGRVSKRSKVAGKWTVWYLVGDEWFRIYLDPHDMRARLTVER